MTMKPSEIDHLLTVQNIRTSFYSQHMEVKAVDGVSFSLPKGKTVGIVGESGSGKSVTALSLLRLIREPGKIKSGKILFKGKDLLEASENDIRKIRGKEISMIFQEPMTSLNPTYTVGQQISESFQIHEGIRKKEAYKRSVDMLKLVGIPSPEKRIHQYPHELSGGMRQRVMIAMSLACNPQLLIADEPTTALDVTIQAQILELIKDLQKQLEMSVLLITHDFGVVSETCDFVAVMYCGKIVEYANAQTIFKRPRHPYTIGLLNSIPSSEEDLEGDLPVIQGTVPSPDALPEGCRFAPRCPFASDICFEKIPELLSDEHGNEVRCWAYADEWDGDPEAEVKIRAERITPSN